MLIWQVPDSLWNNRHIFLETKMSGHKSFYIHETFYKLMTVLIWLINTNYGHIHTFGQIYCDV